MSQKMIDVLLTVYGENDVLIFILDEEDKDKYIVNLNSESSQIALKKVFSKMLELMVNYDIRLELRIVDGYSKVLYKDVCSEYIDNLNHEISIVAETVRKEIL